MLARLDQTIEEATLYADTYKISHAIEQIFTLLDDLSNWYIRRSRRRFWKSEDDADKIEAYKTLHYLLVNICELLAPWAPFITEKLYRDLVVEMEMPESVHLTDWPKSYGKESKSIEVMAKTREYINKGLAQRAEAGIKVRQPLQSVTIPKIPVDLTEVVSEELNVKEVKFTNDDIVVLDTTISDKLLSEGLMRELVRRIQNSRKHADLKVEDRIELYLISEDRAVRQAIENFKETIMKETLSVSLSDEPPEEDYYSETAKINDKEVSIFIVKAG
jgi:isoleucyl-tRNA synthetase